MKKGFFPFSTRFLFSVALICLGLKTMFDIDSNQGFVYQNIRLMSEEIFKVPALKKFCEFSGTVITLQCAFHLLSGVLMLMGINASKAFALFAAIIDVVLVHNPYFYQEKRFLTLTALNISIFGAVLVM
jgi:hypothetical protein